MRPMSTPHFGQNLNNVGLSAQKSCKENPECNYSLRWTPELKFSRVLKVEFCAYWLNSDFKTPANLKGEMA